MKNPFLFLSKTFYILAFVSLFLPTFIPSCCSDKGPPVCNDSVPVEVDSSLTEMDTLATVLPIEEEIQEENETVIPEEKSILQPDGQNFSFWGYLLISFNEGMAWIYVITLFCGGILKFMNRNHKFSAILSLVGFCCLTAIEKNKVVWEFWIIYGISLVLTIVNWIHYCQVRRKLLLNKL